MTATLTARWEARLSRDGLAPLDQIVRGRRIIRTEIITPRPQYVPQPERLAEALEAWIGGDRGVFAPAGLELLARSYGCQDSWRVGRGWPRRRAIWLARICRDMESGLSVRQAARRRGYSEDLAYLYLRPLYAALSASGARGDDDSDCADDGD